MCKLVLRSATRSFLYGSELVVHKLAAKSCPGRMFPLVLTHLERPQLFRMVSHISKNALALLNASDSVSVRRAKIWPHGTHAFKDLCPAAFEGRYGHE